MSDREVIWVIVRVLGPVLLALAAVAVYGYAVGWTEAERPNRSLALLSLGCVSMVGLAVFGRAALGGFLRLSHGVRSKGPPADAFEQLTFGLTWALVFLTLRAGIALNVTCAVAAAVGSVVVGAMWRARSLVLGVKLRDHWN